MREWAAYNRHRLVEHRLFATATTGRILQEELALDSLAADLHPASRAHVA